MGRKKRHCGQQRPLYKCMVKMAMACLKQKPGAARQEIERKVMNLYRKRGLKDSKHPQSIGRAIHNLMKTQCLHKRGSQYQIVSKCARNALSVHKRKRRRKRRRKRSQSRSHSRSRSRSGSRNHGHCPQKKPQRKNRRRRKQRQYQIDYNAPRICHSNVGPQICPTNPICKFPLRDAMIIAMTIFFSYLMQRTASHMQFTTPS